MDSRASFSRAHLAKLVRSTERVCKYVVSCFRRYFFSLVYQLLLDTTTIVPRDSGPFALRITGPREIVTASLPRTTGLDEAAEASTMSRNAIRSRIDASHDGERLGFPSFEVP